MTTHHCYIVCVFVCVLGPKSQFQNWKQKKTPKLRWPSTKILELFCNRDFLKVRFEWKMFNPISNILFFCCRSFLSWPFFLELKHLYLSSPPDCVAFLDFIILITILFIALPHAKMNKNKLNLKLPPGSVTPVDSSNVSPANNDE